MSVPAIGSNEGVEHELGIHHQRDYWYGVACLLDICAAQAGEVLNRMAGFLHTHKGTGFRVKPGMTDSIRLVSAGFPLEFTPCSIRSRNDMLCCDEGRY